jgi:hypothetical protein
MLHWEREESLFSKKRLVLVSIPGQGGLSSSMARKASSPSGLRLPALQPMRLWRETRICFSLIDFKRAALDQMQIRRLELEPALYKSDPPPQKTSIMAPIPELLLISGFYQSHGPSRRHANKQAPLKQASCGSKRPYGILALHRLRQPNILCGWSMMLA